MEKDLASKVAKKAYEMRDSGITEPEQYKNLRLKFKPTRKTNKSGVNNLHYNKTHDKWVVGVMLYGKRYILKNFKSKIKAVTLAKISNTMKKSGILDIQKYREILI